VNFGVHGVKPKCACANTECSEIKLWPSSGLVGLQWLIKHMSVLLWEQLAQDEFRTLYLIKKTEALNTW